MDGSAVRHRSVVRRRPAVVALVAGAVAAATVGGVLWMTPSPRAQAATAAVSSAATAAVSSAVVSSAASTSSSAVTEPGSGSARDRAWAWIRGQQGSDTTVTSASTIAASRTYPADWTGAVSGTFVPRGVSSPVVDGSSIVVDSPGQVAGDYAGAVSGHITLAPSANRWIVQVYRDTGSGRVQVPLQALVAPDGTFTLDLGAVSDPPAGTWALGLLDAANSYAPTGTPWPSATYSDWQVRAYVVTDTAYLVGSEPASASGTFSFASSAPGTKVFQLVDTATGAVLAEDAPDFGLVRSYAGSTRVYAYDQALAVLAALDLGADASSLTDGLMSLQAPDGGFVESADVRNPAAGTALERTGISAVATYALLRRAAAMDPADPARPGVLAAARSGVTWLLAQRRPDGLIGAGVGDYRSDGSLDPAAVPGWVSTEHDIDAWQAMHLAATVLDDPSLAADATALASTIVANLWDPAAGRFLQGIAADGTPDRTDPLDVSSWGALFLVDAGRPDLAAQAAAHLDAFASGTGYRAYYPQAAFPDAPADVWVEGTAGVALAHLRTGTPDDADLAGLAALQNADGSFPYATVADPATGMTTASSVAATAWFLLATGGPTAIW